MSENQQNVGDGNLGKSNWNAIVGGDFWLGEDFRSVLDLPPIFKMWCSTLFKRLGTAESDWYECFCCYIFKIGIGMLCG